MQQILFWKADSSSASHKFLAFYGTKNLIYKSRPLTHNLSQIYPFHYLPTYSFNLLQPTGYVMYHQFNIQQLYALPTLYLCVLYLSENKQRLVPLTA